MPDNENQSELDFSFNIETEKNFEDKDLMLSSVRVPQSGSDARGDVPEADPRYIWPHEALDSLLLYLDKPSDDCLFICGPTGSGKTSLVTNVSAKLGWPLISVTVSNSTEAKELIGRLTASTSGDGKKGVNWHFEYGPLAKAMKNGEILLINEIDTMKGGELTALNDVLDGRDLIIADNGGERIHPAPGFRVIATGNTRGNGEGMGSYEGTRNLNAAFMDRFRVIELDYQPKQSLMKMIAKRAPNLPKQMANDFCKLAEVLRESARNEELTVPLSNRSLGRALDLMEQTGRMTPHRALMEAYGSKLLDYERQSVSEEIKSIFGEYAELSRDDILDKIKKAEEEAKLHPEKAQAQAEGYQQRHVVNKVAELAKKKAAQHR